MAVFLQKTSEEIYANAYAKLITNNDLLYNEKAHKWQQIRRAANCFMEFSGLSSGRKIDEYQITFFKDSAQEEFNKKFYLSSHALPLLVNVAFALELFLRSILVFEGKDPGKKHNTYKLFCKIHKQSQSMVIRSITRYSNASCKFVPGSKEFHEEFLKISNMFVSGRYYYDNIEAPFLKQQGFLIIVLLDVLFRFTNRKIENFYARRNITTNCTS